MGDTATLNVRMDLQTKEEFSSFCEKVGLSASALMNIFAKTVVRNQEVPFPLTTKQSSSTPAYARLLPTNAAELDAMLSKAEATPTDQLVPATAGFKAIEERMGW